MRRFYFNNNDLHGNHVDLSLEESHHISKVLRLECGSPLELLDGKGGVYSGSIVAIDQLVTVEVIEKLHSGITGDNVRIAQGMLKGQKMELLVQKSTELGAAAFLSYYGERSQGKLNDGQAAKKQQRWQRIALEACKQCKRTDTMVVGTSVSFSDLVKATEVDGRLRLIFWEEEKSVVLNDFELQEFSGVDIILGPEGGLSQNEIDLARQYGWQTVSLGKRILRAETAGIIALGLVQFLSGNLS